MTKRSEPKFKKGDRVVPYTDEYIAAMWNRADVPRGDHIYSHSRRGRIVEVHVVPRHDMVYYVIWIDGEFDISYKEHEDYLVPFEEYVRDTI